LVDVELDEVRCDPVLSGNIRLS